MKTLNTILAASVAILAAMPAFATHDFFGGGSKPSATAPWTGGLSVDLKKEQESTVGGGGEVAPGLGNSASTSGNSWAKADNRANGKVGYQQQNCGAGGCSGENSLWAVNHDSGETAGGGEAGRQGNAGTAYNFNAYQQSKSNAWGKWSW